MTFNQLTTTAFFDNGPQMALLPVVRQRFALEGLATVEDFADFKKEQLKEAIKNLRTAIPRVVDGGVAVADIPAIPPCIVSAKCALRLQVASAAYHYYVSIGRARTPANMNYTNTLRGFYVEYEALITLSDEKKPVVPVLTKHQTPLKWIESFKDCLYRTYGIRKCPLLYVIRADATVPDEVADPLTPSLAYGQSGSLLDELIARLTHTDPLYKSDNAMVYSLLEEATRGTVYSSTVKPYQKGKNGRAAWLSMVSSHAGQDKWEQMQKDKMKFIMNTKWNGRTYSLEKFTGIHRTAYVQLEEASIHVNFQLPTEHTRVGYLIDNIQNNDPDLRAALASIRINTNNMREDFEAAVTFMLPVCPYAKHRSSNGNEKRGAQVSDATLLGKKHSKTGVDLRWHNKVEYAKLTKEQRSELYNWQQTKDGKDKMSKDRNKGFQGTGSTKKQLQAKINALEAQHVEIATVMAAAAAPAPLPPALPLPLPTAPTVSAAAAAPPAHATPSQVAIHAVQGILKRKRE